MISIEKVQRYDQKWTSLRKKLTSRQKGRYEPIHKASTLQHKFEGLRAVDGIPSGIRSVGRGDEEAEIQRGKSVRVADSIHDRNQKLQLEAVK